MQRTWRSNRFITGLDDREQAASPKTNALTLTPSWESFIGSQAAGGRDPAEFSETDLCQNGRPAAPRTDG